MRIHSFANHNKSIQKSGLAWQGWRNPEVSCYFLDENPDIAHLHLAPASYITKKNQPRNISIIEKSCSNNVMTTIYTMWCHKLICFLFIVQLRQSVNSHLMRLANLLYSCFCVLCCDIQLFNPEVKIRVKVLSHWVVLISYLTFTDLNFLLRDCKPGGQRSGRSLLWQDI